MAQFHFILDRHSSRVRQRGITLLETLLALAIGAVVMIAFAQAAQQRANSILESAAAAQMKEVAKGAKAFVSDNYSTLRDNAPQVLSPAAMTGYMPPNLQRDAFGQDYVLLTRPSTISGVPGIEALVVAGDATRPLTFDNIAGVASLAGAAAGFYAQSEPPLQCSGRDVCGAYGFYAIDTTGFLPSGFATPTVVSYIEANNGNAFSDYLYRVAVPGEPQLNRMSTDIDMDGNDIANIGAARFENGGGIAESGNDLRLWSNTGGWVTIQKENGGSQSLMVAGSIGAMNDIEACALGGAGCGVTLTDAGGLVKRANGYLNLEVEGSGSNGVYVSGGDKGGIVNAADVYLRDRGAWLTDLLPNYIAKYGYIVGDNSNLAKPSCPTGQTPKIVLSPHFFSLFVRSTSAPANNRNVANDAVLQMWATDLGGSWRTEIKTYGESGVQSAGPNARAVAIVYCYSPS